MRLLPSVLVNFKEVYTSNICKLNINPNWTTRQFLDNIWPHISRHFNTHNFEIIEAGKNTYDYPAEAAPSLQRTNIKLKDKYYYPHPRSGSSPDAASLLNLEGGSSKDFSAIVPNMKPRQPKSTSPFEIIGAQDMLNRYIESMAHAKEFIPITKDVYSLLSKNNIPHIINKFNDINKKMFYIAMLRLNFIIVYFCNAD